MDIQNLEQKLFGECKSLINSLLESNDVQNLLEKELLVSQLKDRMEFLKYLKNITFETENDTQSEQNIPSFEILEEEISEKEEIIFDEKTELLSFEVLEEEAEELLPEIEIEEEPSEPISFEVLEEEAEETLPEVKEEKQDKKMKMPSIKGLHNTAETLSLFDVIEDEVPQNTTKQKPEFRLDLNDRIAFTKILFSGSQVQLNETVKALNDCKTLDEAQEYLSEVYYERNWEKVDEYAQRLWTLVENKFL
ncbi:MAG: hypothetical protein Q4C75_03525 [Bergeyella zoohelcum]|nr:hypothetical protein [Bergeyella zoohelcum]